MTESAIAAGAIARATAKASRANGNLLIFPPESPLWAFVLQVPPAEGWQKVNCDFGGLRVKSKNMACHRHSDQYPAYFQRRIGPTLRGPGAYLFDRKD